MIKRKKKRIFFYRQTYFRGWNRRYRLIRNPAPPSGPLGKRMTPSGGRWFCIKSDDELCPVIPLLCETFLLLSKGELNLLSTSELGLESRKEKEWRTTSTESYTRGWEVGEIKKKNNFFNTHSVVSSGLLADPSIRNLACAYSCSLCRSDFVGAFGFTSVFVLLFCSNVGRFKIFTVGSVGPYVLSLSSSFNNSILTAPWLLLPFRCGDADCRFDSRFSWFNLDVNCNGKRKILRWHPSIKHTHNIHRLFLYLLRTFISQWHTFWGYATTVEWKKNLFQNSISTNPHYEPEFVHSFNVRQNWLTGRNN